MSAQYDTVGNKRALAPEAVEKFGAEFWREYRENPLLVVLSGRR